MKKSIAIFAALFFVIFAVQAQKGLTGPAAKNAKPWKQDKPATKIVTYDVEKNDLNGPEAKNFKPGQHDREILMVADIQGSDKKGLKGPAAKNYKPNAPDKDIRNVAIGD